MPQELVLVLIGAGIGAVAAILGCIIGGYVQGWSWSSKGDLPIIPLAYWPARGRR